MAFAERNGHNYEEAKKIYLDLIRHKTESAIPYTNLGYMCAYGLECRTDYNAAKYFYSMASEKGSEIANGNIVCLYGYAIFTAEEFFNHLNNSLIYKDDRGEIFLNYLLKELELSKNQFFHKSLQNKAELIDYILNNRTNNRNSNFELGWSNIFNSENTNLSTRALVYDFKEMPLDLSDKQMLEYPSPDVTESTLNSLLDLSSIDSNPSMIYAEILYILYDSKCIFEYDRLEDSNSPIVSNNLGVIYCNTLLPGLNSSDNDLKLITSKGYFDESIEQGSKIAAGNILSSYKRFGLSPSEFHKYLVLATDVNDNRVEKIIEKIYYVLSLEKEKDSFKLDYFDKSDKNQIDMIAKAFDRKTMRLNYSHSHSRANYISIEDVHITYSAESPNELLKCITIGHNYEDPRTELILLTVYNVLDIETRIADTATETFFALDLQNQLEIIRSFLECKGTDNLIENEYNFSGSNVYYKTFNVYDYYESYAFDTYTQTYFEHYK